jgi:hemerythrin
LFLVWRPGRDRGLPNYSAAARRRAIPAGPGLIHVKASVAGAVYLPGRECPMALIEWSKNFEIGVPAIDREHRELVALVNRVYGRLIAPGSDITISDFLGEIHARIAAHFESEERLMRARRYDQLEAHAAEHERLLDEIRAMIRDYEHQREYDELRFAARLSEWFSKHFQSHDARLRELLS